MSIIYQDKIAYAARNNNLNADLVARIVDVLSERNADKVVINEYISYDVSHKDRDIDAIGKYYNWGLMQVPGILFFELSKTIPFLARNVIELLAPIKNLDTGCKIIKSLKNGSFNLDSALKKYITSDLNYDVMIGDLDEVVKRIVK